MSVSSWPYDRTSHYECVYPTPLQYPHKYVKAYLDDRTSDWPIGDFDVLKCLPSLIGQTVNDALVEGWPKAWSTSEKAEALDVLGQVLVKMRPIEHAESDLIDAARVAAAKALTFDFGYSHLTATICIADLETETDPNVAGPVISALANSLEAPGLKIVADLKNRALLALKRITFMTSLGSSVTEKARNLYEKLAETPEPTPSPDDTDGGAQDQRIRKRPSYVAPLAVVATTVVGMLIGFAVWNVIDARGR